MLLLHLSASFSLTLQQVQTWQSALDESVACDALGGIELSPLRLTLTLGGSYEPRDLTTELIAAFARVGITQGAFEIALSEHDRDDSELETPAFYEATVDLARAPEPELARVQVEIMHAEPYLPAELEVLERELRAHVTWPIESFGAVFPSIEGRHLARLELVPMAKEELPAPAALKANIAEALAAAQLKPRRVKVGAYLGTWDNTLFDETL